ncbi:glycosyltransferase family 39 protein [Flavobacteriales bacterium]|nr:glycosyltransferase family 39 protein [Flavobacteriales bacterium]
MARKKPQNKKQEIEDNSFPKKEGFNLSKIDWTWLLFGVMMLVVVVIRMNFLSIPFERDEGTYTYFGQLILDGKIPYVDFYEMKLPGIYYCYALIIALFGATLEGAHTGFLIVNLLTIFFMFRAGALWFSKIVGLVIATAFAILAMNPHVSGFTTQSEHLVAFFVAAALLILLKGLEKESYKYYFFSGVLFAGSVLIKQNGVFFALFGGLAVTGHYLLNKKWDWKNMFSSGVVYSLGVLAPILFVVVIISVQGAFEEFIYWIYEHPKAYVGGIDWDPQGKQLFNVAWSNISRNHYLLFVLAMVGAVAISFSKMSWHKKGMVWTFGLLSFLAITPGLRFYGHYWIYFMPGVAVLIGAAVFSTEEILRRYMKQRLAKYVALSIFLLVLGHHLHKINNDTVIKNYYSRPDAMNVLRKVYGQNPFPESKIVGDWIKNNSEEGDQIAILGSEPQIFFYADRRGVSKHNYCGYLVKNTPHHAEWQQEYIADVEAAMPKFLVYFRHPVSWLTQPNVDMSIFQWFDPFANKNYDLVGMTQVLSENQLAYKWGKQEAGQMMQNMRKQENTLREKMNAAAQSGNQQEVDNLRNQLQIFNFEIIVFQRKEGVISSLQQ